MQKNTLVALVAGAVRVVYPVLHAALQTHRGWGSGNRVDTGVISPKHPRHRQ
jgi:hypothetical protein